MREIKFRAWDKPENQMIQSIGISKNGIAFECVHSNDSGSDYEEFEQYILMQYTGLKDKKGKDIYEGDIVTWIDECANDHDGERQSGYFVFSWSLYDASFMLDQGSSSFGFGECDTFEVIGNIYENPELLKETSSDKTSNK